MATKPATLKSMQRSSKTAPNRTRERRATRPQEAVVISTNSLGGVAPPKSIGEVRKILSEAFDGIGGQRSFERWAKKNPAKFYEMWSRMLPRQSNVDVTVTSLEDLLAKVAAAEGKDEVVDGGYLTISDNRSSDTVLGDNDAGTVPVSEGLRQGEARMGQEESPEAGGPGVGVSKRRRRL